MLSLLCGSIVVEELMKIFKRYSELIRFPTFEERFNYLKLNGSVGRDTFGFDRVFNQMFYSSLEWKQCRDKVIARDLGCDLGISDAISGSLAMKSLGRELLSII